MNDSNWGGKRKGAGRKKGNIVYKTISIVLPEEESVLLKRIANERKMTVSRLVSKVFGLEEIVKLQKEESKIV